MQHAYPEDEVCQYRVFYFYLFILVLKYED
jgi:hypothetical protein